MGNPSGDLAMEKNVYWRILRKQLNLMGTWNSSYEKDEACDWTEALDALSKKKIPAQALITHCFPSEKLMDGLELMKNHKAVSYTHLLPKLHLRVPGRSHLKYRRRSSPISYYHR